MPKPPENFAAAAAFGRRQVLGAGALAVGSLALPQRRSFAATGGEISRSAESIHQEPTFSAARQRVYEVLTDGRQFDAVVQASGAMKDPAQMKEPTRISPDEGGSFVLFGGHIRGRHVLLVPGELLVQAWRAGGWNRGVYSIARFELLDLNPGTRIVFDHTGFPNGQAQHLAAGWHEHYWAPLAKVLAA